MSHEFSTEEKLITEKVDYVTEEIRRGNILLYSDLDGSRVDTAPLAVTVFNEENNTDHRMDEMMGTWDMVVWAEQLGKQNPRQYAIDLWNSDRVMRHALPVHGAVELSKHLFTHRDSKIVIPSVTARPSTTRGATSVWHDKWMPWYKDNNHLFMQTEGSVNTRFKAETLKVEGPTYYFEDQPSDAELIARASPGTTVIMVSQRYNEQYIVPQEFHGRILLTNRDTARPKVLDAFYTMIQHATR